MDLITLSRLLLVSGCISHVVASPKVVSVPFARSVRSAPVARRDATAVTLTNQQLTFYSVNVTVGTPPQQLTLDVDTGSSDIWFFNPSACEEAGCIAGTFDPTKSTSYNLIEEGTFNISYADESGASGDYFSDVIDLGGGLKVSNQTMALATAAKDNQNGLFGIAFRNNEAGAAQGDEPFPTIVDSFVNADLIESHSYSLWLDDLESSTGTILFGGYDSEQYIGDLTILSILPDFDNKLFLHDNTLISFTVDLSMIALTDGSGSSTIIQQKEYPVPAILDSGTSLTQLPPDSFYQLAQYFGATFDERAGGYLVSCKIASWKGSVDYGFGGASGAIIQVPFAELALDNGDGTCSFGLSPAGDGILIGDTFLRSAYVVYNLDANEIGIAQSAWNSNTSNIQAIGAGTNLASLIKGSHDDSSASVAPQYYTSLYNLETATNSPVLRTSPATASVSGVKTSFSAVAAATEPAATAASSSSQTSTGGGAIQTAAMLLPMALPFAAALL